MKSSGKLIIMNWKCNPASVKEVKSLVSASDSANVVLCPPAPFLSLIGGSLKTASLGAQDGHFGEGAFTGEYSFKQLKAVGVRYAIIGHSERRGMFGETSEEVSKKTGAALDAGVVPIVCVGEKKRKNISDAVRQVVAQMESSLSGVPKDKAGKIVLAYEPVWAISTTAGGKGNASLSEMEPVMSAMAEKFSALFGKKAKVLYGGSVNPENAGIYAACSSVQGVLVGGASINPKKAATVIKLMQSK